MKRGFYTIMSAQFFSSLADNALLVGAIELLRTTHAPAWQVPALSPMFALFYVLLAPLVGAFADAVPKGRVMFVSNTIKVLGCVLMLFGGHPLWSYAVVGLGAAAYSPAKYGILTELLPPSQLVKANGWIEGLTIASIILGVLLGGQLVGGRVAPWLLTFDFPFIDTGVDTPPEAAISSIVVLYVIAAVFNLYIPRTDAPLQPLNGNVISLVGDFSQCNARLWADKLGQIVSDAAAKNIAWVQPIKAAPYFAHAQFSDAKTILSLTDPGADFPYVQAMWHYARGVGLAEKYPPEFRHVNVVPRVVTPPHDPFGIVCHELHNIPGSIQNGRAMLAHFEMRLHAGP
jgi:MFS family permease